MRIPDFGVIERDGWTLVSAEERHARSPETFVIPSRTERESLTAGDGVKLLFDIETRDVGNVIDRGVDRLWVIVKRKTGSLYVGVLDSDPRISEGLTLRPGTELLFGPEHVSAINRPPEGYILERFGPEFFDG